MNTFISPNSKLISIVLNPSNGDTTASQIFPTQEELQDRKIIAIETFTASDIPFDPLNSGVAVMPDNVAGLWFTTLYVAAVKNSLFYSQHQESGLFYDKIPYGRTRAVSNNDTAVAGSSFSRGGILIIRPTELAFNKCKIEAPTSQAQATPYSAVYMFHYLDKGDDGQWWIEAMGYGKGK